MIKPKALFSCEEFKSGKFLDQYDFKLPTFFIEYICSDMFRLYDRCT